jgi:hypothetical protein
LRIAGLVNEDVRSYLSMKVDGIISCGSQRSFFPTGVALYSLGRSMFDSSLSAEEIIEDYFSHVFGEDWREFADYLGKIEAEMPYEVLDLERRKRHRMIVNEENTRIYDRVKSVVESGRQLIKSHYNSDVRVRTLAVRLLEKHSEYCERLAEAVSERANGRVDDALALLDKLRIDFGRYEPEIEEYFDHNLYFRAMKMLLGKCSGELDVGN